MPDSSRAHAFDTAADRYASSRPSYPPAVLDAVEEIWGRPLAGSRAADVGAGTGIATALLHERRADVIAVEPGAGMVAAFRGALPDLPVVQGDGNALPLADASRDLITYAQSWHWTDTARSVPEALRVLRPGGALALWWNTDAVDTPWALAQQERVARFLGTAPKTGERPDDARAVELAGVAGLGCTRRLMRWSRTVPFHTHLANIASRSAFLVLGEPAARTFLDEEHAHLRASFPDGSVEETYVVDLLVVTRP
ncbi:class I SAM-dependent methyltransferase [Streptomyces sp. NPDC002537]